MERNRRARRQNTRWKYSESVQHAEGQGSRINGGMSANAFSASTVFILCFSDSAPSAESTCREGECEARGEECTQRWESIQKSTL